MPFSDSVSARYSKRMTSLFCFCIVGDVALPGVENEEPVLRLRVVHRGLGLHDLEPDRVLPDAECVVEEIFPGLDVVLVFVCPVEQHLFTVVGNCKLLLRRVPAHTHEIPIVVVPGEELVDVVEDLGFVLIRDGCRQYMPPSSLCTRLCQISTNRCVGKLRIEIARREKSGRSERLIDRGFPVHPLLFLAAPSSVS